MPNKPVVLIVGSASLDVVRLPDGRTVRSPGGAGLYTALAAANAGAAVRLFGIRPDPMPAALALLAEKVAWIGPVAPPDDLPALEIRHYGGGKAELKGARWGAEPVLIDPERLPDAALAGVDIAYCAPLSDPARQLGFVRRFNRAGVRSGCGTYARAAGGFTAVVRQAVAEAELFFCNENEARLLFGGLAAATTGPTQTLFVTQAANGVDVINGVGRTHVAAHPADEVDPTGAGDVFCGATLAGMAQGLDARAAAAAAVGPAAALVGAIGPSALWTWPSGGR